MMVAVANTPVSNFRIPEDLKAQAKAAAAEDGISLTELVIAGIEMYLTSRERTE